MEGGGCFGGISRCAGLIDIGTEEDISEGAPASRGLLVGRAAEVASGRSPAARGCSMEGQRRLLLGDLPLRGADRRKDGGGCFWGSPAARGCSKEGRSKLSVGELPLRRSARKEGRSNLSALGDLLLRGADR